MNVLQHTSIVTVPVLDDGSAGEIVPYVVTENEFIGDGLALDADGRVYVTDFLTEGIVRTDVDGSIVPIAGGADAGFDNSTSLTWGIGATEQTLYVVNLAGGSFEPSDKPGPALIVIDVDAAGMPLP